MWHTSKCLWQVFFKMPVTFPTCPWKFWKKSPWNFRPCPWQFSIILDARENARSARDNIQKKLCHGHFGLSREIKKNRSREGKSFVHAPGMWCRSKFFQDVDLMSKMEAIDEKLIFPWPFLYESLQAQYKSILVQGYRGKTPQGGGFFFISI